MAAAEMALIRLCYAADLPGPEEALKALRDGTPVGGGGGGGVSVGGGSSGGGVSAQAVSMPMARKTSSKGAPSRLDSWPRRMLNATSAAPARIS